ncbi:putative metal-dependent phosphotriesterase family hydrolase [Lysinibacillus sp. RC46]|uniref:phosphotriesterase family protein n=1 Tax=unclassified Lysinibacillus TaxID=2636778 RepID=UPI003518D749
MTDKIRTVLGDISKEALGFTYSHEHLWCCPPPQQKDRDFELTNYEASLEELKTFKNIGGETLVDASTLDYGRDGNKLKRMAEESGINVLGVTGFNKHIYFDDWVETESIDQIVDRLVHDIQVGMDGSDAKAGILKAGSWYNVILPLEEKITRAVGRAQKITGAPVWLHTESGTLGVEMLDILEDEGVDLHLVAVGHSDRNADPYYHLNILERGSYIQFDGPGKVKYYPDNIRIDLIKNVLAHGYGHKLLISGDMGRQSYLHAYGGGPGFRYIKQKFIPRMLNERISQHAINQIFYTNPADWLAKF